MCVPAAGRAGERGAEIRRQNASHRASIARHRRAANPTTAAATAATTLRGPRGDGAPGTTLYACTWVYFLTFLLANRLPARVVAPLSHPV